MGRGGKIEMKRYKNIMTSFRQDWETPQDLYNKLNEEFNFDLDPCANSENAKCPVYFSENENGLKKKWFGNVFMNPPYGRKMGEWIEKAYLESLKGVTVVCLLPSRTDTIWWHDFIMRASEIRFIKGRLKFGKNPNSRATFPSVVVIFKGAA